MARFSSPYATGRFFLRAGMAFAFLYPPFAAIQDPVAWSGYFPAFVQAFPIDTFVLLHLFGILEVIIALWFLWGHKLRAPGILAAILLLAIIVFNLNDFAILFRDVALAFAALALAFLPEPEGIRI